MSRKPKAHHPGVSVQALTEAVIAALPKTVTLFYVAYDDSLTNEQAARALGGELDEVRDQVQDHFVDYDQEPMETLLREALARVPGFPDLPVLAAGAEDPEETAVQLILEDSEAWEAFREACYDRDDSDVFGELVENTRYRMVRFQLGPEILEVPEEPVEREVYYHQLLTALGLDPRTNTAALIELIDNAGDGALCVLAYVSLETLTQGIDYLLGDPAQRRLRLTFTDPHLLCYEGGGGSGHDVRVQGRMHLELRASDLGYPEGRLELDHKGAGTGYSWSDEIAGVVYSAYETPFTLRKTTVSACPDRQ